MCERGRHERVDYLFALGPEEVEPAGLAERLLERAAISFGEAATRLRARSMARRSAILASLLGRRHFDRVVGAPRWLTSRPGQAGLARGRAVRMAGLEPYRRKPRSSFISRSCSDHAGLRRHRVPVRPGCSRYLPPRVAAGWQQDSVGEWTENGFQVHSLRLGPRFVRQHGVSKSSAPRTRRLSGTAPMSKVATLQQPLTQRPVAMTRAEGRSWSPSAHAACSHNLQRSSCPGSGHSLVQRPTGGRPRLGSRSKPPRS
jgi:hypothetical protein